MDITPFQTVNLPFASASEAYSRWRYIKWIIIIIIIITCVNVGGIILSMYRILKGKTMNELTLIVYVE